MAAAPRIGVAVSGTCSCGAVIRRRSLATRRPGSGWTWNRPGVRPANLSSGFVVACSWTPLRAGVSPRQKKECRPEPLGSPTFVLGTGRPRGPAGDRGRSGRRRCRRRTATNSRPLAFAAAPCWASPWRTRSCQNCTRRAFNAGECADCPITRPGTGNHPTSTGRRQGTALLRNRRNPRSWFHSDTEADEHAVRSKRSAAMNDPWDSRKS
jgi:hypothetical protein